MKTSNAGNREPGRPRKHVGLAIDSLRKVADREDVREVQAAGEKRGAVLSESRDRDADPDGSGRVFAAAQPANSGRISEVVPASLSHGQDSTPESLEVGFTLLLRNILREIAAPKHQDRDTTMTNLEVLTRRMVEDSMMGNMGSHRAREFIIERLEGKAVRGEKPAVSDTTLDDQLSEAEAVLLNSFSKEKSNVSVSSGQDGDRSDR